MEHQPRVGIFGWGIVAPRSPDTETFARNLESSESWLSPFNGFGPDNFLVGVPEFALERHRAWIDKRFPPSRFSQLESKMGWPAQFAIGAFIEALGQNPGLEEELQRLGSLAHVYIGTGVGDLPTLHAQSLELERAQMKWDAFWAAPRRNAALRAYLRADLDDPATAGCEVPAPPQTVAEEDRWWAERDWCHFWASRSDQLQEYLTELRAIEGLDIDGDSASAKGHLIKKKRVLNARLQAKWGAPEPPWNQVSANVIWNIHNTPASQVSMMGKITGLVFAPVAACATFGVALKLAMNAIEMGQAKAVVVGASDPPPHPLLVGAFYNARVISADGEVSKPLTGLRGTHISGGSAVWIVGDYEHMTARGFKPLGLEPLTVGVSADADHIITPSTHGPAQAMQSALEQARVEARDLVSWDLHATATPGDVTEVETLRRVIAHNGVLVTARKGTFGHGMAAGGGWELTAQFLGLTRGCLHPTPLPCRELNSEIAELHDHFVFDRPVPVPKAAVGKLSMGIGGINACVISRPWP